MHDKYLSPLLLYQHTHIGMDKICIKCGDEYSNKTIHMVICGMWILWICARLYTKSLSTIVYAIRL